MITNENCIEIQMQAYEKLLLAHFTKFPEALIKKGNLNEYLNIKTPFRLVSIFQPELELKNSIYGDTIFTPGERRDFDDDIMSVLFNSQQELSNAVHGIQQTIALFNGALSK
jgi:hypothetical protein